eukprot:10459006-Alexandrium_andersonii.AAC.1
MQLQVLPIPLGSVRASSAKGGRAVAQSNSTLARKDIIRNTNNPRGGRDTPPAIGRGAGGSRAEE